MIKLNKIIIKLKGFLPVKFKTYLKKFRNYNGYEGLDKRMLKYINYSNGFYIECGANDGVNQSNTWYFDYVQLLYVLHLYQRQLSAIHLELFLMHPLQS